MGLTATAFGLLVTALGGLFTAVVLLARRELDRGRDQLMALATGILGAAKFAKALDAVRAPSAG